jgi:polyhydroxyalkanoate synthase
MTTMTTRPDLPPSEQRRDASAWQGIRPRYPEARIEHAPIDLALGA